MFCKQLLQQGYALLQDVPGGRKDCEEILAAILQKKRSELFFYEKSMLSKQQVEQTLQKLLRRKRREPLDYILQTKSFLGLSLQVDARALAPRVETEILVDTVIKSLTDPLSIWDLGTGSGAIGLSLQKAFPKAQVTLIDICPKALSLAKENAQNLAIPVSFLQISSLQDLVKMPCPEVIVCNPPYISSEEYKQAEPELFYEPKKALVSGKTGLEFYEKMAPLLEVLAQKNLKYVFFEIGHLQKKSLLQIFYNWQAVCKKDWAGHDRFFFLEKQSKPRLR